MSLIYKIYQNKNAKNPKSYNKFYARAIHNDTATLEQIAAIIERNCSLKRSDVHAVLTELVEVMSSQMKDSKRVKLDGLGTFKIAIATEGVDDAKKFSPQKHIKRMKINFYPECRKITGSKKFMKPMVDGVSMREMESYGASHDKTEKVEKAETTIVEPSTSQPSSGESNPSTPSSSTSTEGDPHGATI